MKFGQLTEYNMRHIFLEKVYTWCGGKTTPRPFYRKSKLSIPLDQQLFLLYIQASVYQNVLKQRCLWHAFILHEGVLKYKRNYFKLQLCPVCGVINFEINHSFVIKPFLYFFYKTRKPRQKFIYLKNEKSLKHELKSIFYHFERAFSSQKLS